MCPYVFTSYERGEGRGKEREREKGVLHSVASMMLLMSLHQYT